MLCSYSLNRRSKKRSQKPCKKLDLFTNTILKLLWSDRKYVAKVEIGSSLIRLYGNTSALHSSSEIYKFCLLDWLQCTELNVDREVLFIEVSLKCYLEDIFSSCKVWQLQRWDYKTVSVAQSKNLLDWKLLGCAMAIVNPPGGKVVNYTTVHCTGEIITTFLLTHFLLRIQVFSIIG